MRINMASRLRESLIRRVSSAIRRPGNLAALIPEAPSAVELNMQPAVIDAKDIKGYLTYAELSEKVIRLPNLIIGGKKAEKLLQKFSATLGIGRISDWALQMVSSEEFETLRRPETVGLLIATPLAMGLTGESTTEQIYARAKELGWDICPPETALYLTMSMQELPLQGAYNIAMDQIHSPFGHPDIFQIQKGFSTGLWELHADWGSGDTRWSPLTSFIFTSSPQVETSSKFA